MQFFPDLFIFITKMKHWHSTVKGNWFQHMTYVTDVNEGLVTNDMSLLMPKNMKKCLKR